MVVESADAYFVAVVGDHDDWLGSSASSEPMESTPLAGPKTWFTPTTVASR
jgi:hypothetical protein